MVKPGHVIVVLCFAGLLFVPAPVSADELWPTTTDIFFEKDRLPYNESVQFTVNCYGYGCKSWDCHLDPEDRLAQNGNYSPELYYSYHATAATYGSRIYEPYYHAGRGYTDYCNLEGVTKGEHFSILNFSQSPLPKNCTDLNPFQMSGGRGRYWNYTPKYDACINTTRLERQVCNDYLTVCDSRTDTECHGYVMNGNNFKETSAFRSCVNRTDEKREDCKELLQPVDPATLVMWKDTRDGNELPSMRACELRFTIPTDNPDPAISPALELTLDPVRYASPVESIYCSLLSLFGARC